MNYKRIGMTLKLERVKRDMTIVDIAKKTGMSITTICRIENGRVFRLQSLKKVADVFGLKIESLIMEEEEK